MILDAQVQRWAAMNGCTGMPQVTWRLPASGGKEHVTTTYTRCLNGTEVALLIVAGMRHSPYLSSWGPPVYWPWHDERLDTTRIAWQFMRNATSRRLT